MILILPQRQPPFFSSAGTAVVAVSISTIHAISYRALIDNRAWGRGGGGFSQRIFIFWYCFVCFTPRSPLSCQYVNCCIYYKLILADVPSHNQAFTTYKYTADVSLHIPFLSPQYCCILVHVYQRLFVFGGNRFLFLSCWRVVLLR